MGAMFRGDEMVLAQLFIQQEAAYLFMSEMGEIGFVQFKDLNEDVRVSERNFFNEVTRCNEMERKLSYIETEVKKYDVDIPESYDLPKAPNPKKIIMLEAQLEKTEGEIKEISENAINLKTLFLELTEFREVLDKAQPFLIHEEESNNADTATVESLPKDKHVVSIRGGLDFVAGVVNRERVPAFERMLWRISGGNIFLGLVNINKSMEDPRTGKKIIKTVFVAFFQGEQLKNRIQKVCTGFHATIYPCPNTTAERNDMLLSISMRIGDLKLVLNRTEDHLKKVLSNVAKDLQNWRVMVIKMKGIYHTLNYFNMDAIRTCLIGECWVSVEDIDKLKNTLENSSNASGSSIASFVNVIKTHEVPPTFNRTNKFTKGFQNLTDAYGVATYRECNPALYTIITFPFLFAMMFGDAGHGSILFLFGLFMCLSEKKLHAKKIKNEMWTILFSGRYIILLMGLFSMYTGLIYNDLFSKSVNIFGTSWTNNVKGITNKSIHDRGAKAYTLNPKGDYSTIPYPVGVDPMWQLGKNKIQFLNTYKMKISIIFGVVHMIFGMCLSVFNIVHFGNMEDIYLDFLPQILFLVCLFWWLCMLIFLKFFMYSAENEGKYGTYCAPSVLIYFINNMLFKPGHPFPSCDEFMFKGQFEFQKFLLAVAVACVPVMLLGKPIYIILTRNKKKKPVVRFKDEVVDEPKPSTSHVHEEEKPPQEIFTDQETEFEPEVVDEPKPNTSHVHENEVPLQEIFISQSAKPSISFALEEKEFRTIFINRDMELPDPDEPKKSSSHIILDANDPVQDLLINQSIYTIQCVLSTVSHTASYLRLWALSLAHAQLSEVLWNMVLQKGLKNRGYMGAIKLYFIFGAWAVLTVGILVIIEGLSAFLHTLRLHWVEFMSKFYGGFGYPFQPFSFKIILSEQRQ